jgi:tellurite resistance protein TehA-like permease
VRKIQRVTGPTDITKAEPHAAQGIRPRLRRAISELPPSAFAVVMATGIVAIAAHQQGLDSLAWVLFAVAAAALLICWALLATRVVRHPARVLAGLQDHSSSAAFFTAVAGTAVVGSACIVVGAALPLASALWGLAAVTWLVLGYAVFFGLTIAADKPRLENGINGTWLLAVVATQSLSVLAGLLSPEMPQPLRLYVNFTALCAWLVGGMLYAWQITLIFYRYMFLPFRVADLTPAYWINMGAMAISTLAGARLVLDVPQAQFLESLSPFLRGVTVLFWATGTWWLPLLLLLTAWKHLVRREPVRYHFGQWSVVFPLGMYSAATHEMSAALGLGFLGMLETAFFWAAVVAWAIVGAGMLRRGWVGVRGTVGD